MEWIQIASTFGFPALFAVILFVTYREQVSRESEKSERWFDKISEVVKTNTEALRDTCATNTRLIERLDALERLIQQRERA